jgi:RNA polymerase sigma factor (sigma-70 family)
MMTTEKSCTAETADAELVAESLAGGRDAFRQIVERHQTLVCSLAYCATGSLTQSEDLAQETFLAAWRQLAELREPSKLRPWLCGIARFVIGKELRRQDREPVHAAETLEAVNELPAPEPLPSERVISKEEQAILWRCVARIPEIYREPLVLFYREHQSIERVAEALELSEDAVKQRLARGRKLLQEQALAYVEGALQGTNPGHAFTVGVLAALPLSATSAKALTVGAAVKGSSTATTVAGLAALGAMILYWSLLGFLAFAGGCAGYWMSRACARSSRQCDYAIQFWRPLAWVFAVSFFGRQFLFPFHGVMVGGGWHPGWFIWRLSWDLYNVVVVAALAIWMRQWWREMSGGTAVPEEPMKPIKRRFVLWLSLGMIGPACFFVPMLGGMLWHTFGPPQEQHVSSAEARKIITERKDAWLTVMEEDGTKTLHLHLPENDPGTKLWAAAHMPTWWNLWTAGSKPAWWNLWTAAKEGNTGTWLTYLIYCSGYNPVELWTAADESMLKLLNETEIHYGTGFKMYVSREAWPFGSLLPFFIGPMGAVIILRQIGKRQWTTTAPGISEALERENKYGRTLLALRSDPSARRVSGIAFAATFLLVFSANAFTATKAFTAMGLYVVLFLGSVKGAFFGLVAGVGVLYLRTLRKASKSGLNI